MTDIETNSKYPALEVSQNECDAMQLLAEDDYTHAEIAFMFEVADSTAGRHIRGECPHE
jgi:hypothetical protein